MSRGFWKICFIFLTIVVFFVIAREASALSLSPAVVEVEAEAGESLVQKIILFNETDQPVTVYPGLENFKTQEESPAPQFLGDTDPFGAARWIFLPIKRVTLKPGELTEILLKIKTPDAAEPGGHYAALLWSEKPAEDVGISTASRVGTIFLFKVKGEIKEDAKIISFQKTMGSQPIEFVLRLQNDGNAHLKPGGIIEIVNWRGKIVAQMPINLKGQSILPQSQRNFVTTVADNNFFPGWCSARADVVYGASAKTLSAQMNFWFWPENFGNKILGFIAVLLLFGVIFKIARRRARHLAIILLLSCFFVLPVLGISTSTDGTTTVSATVPNQGGGGGDLPPPPPPPPVPDTTSPATVTDLSAGSPTKDSITLTWTAPGDDGSSGTASSYDIRSSLFNITDANWAGVVPIVNAPTPLVAGTAQSVVVSGLSANTKYYFALKTSDEASNLSALSNVVSATTLPESADTTAPKIDSIVIKAGVTSAEISWHTDELADSQIAYGLTNQLGKSSIDSVLSVSHKITLTNLTPDTIYYSKIISSDASGNQTVGLQNGSEIGTFQTLKDTTAPANVSGFSAAAGDKKISLSWQNPPDSDFYGVVIVRKTSGFPVSISDGTVFSIVKGNQSQADSLIDNQGLTNGVVYYYTAFAGDKYENYASGAITQATPEAGGELPIVPGPEEAPLPSGGNIPGGGGSVEGLQLTNFIFTAAKGKITMPASSQFEALVHSEIGVALPNNKAPKEIESIILSVAGGSYLFNFSVPKQTWQTEFVVPTTPGTYSAVLTVNFIDQTSGVFNWQLQSAPYGQIYEKKKGQKILLSGATISLYQQNQLWPAVSFHQNNPQITGADGIFGFMVQPGKYLLKIQKTGFSTETINISVAGMVVNSSVELLYFPPAIKDVIKPGAPLAENIANVVQNLGEQSVFISKKVLKEIGYGARQAADKAKEIINNPEAQKIAEDVAAPALASVAVAGTAAVIGWAQLLNYLRFLFTQPLLLIKRRKRHGWGVVYNSLTKLPLGLIILRLVDTKSGRIVQTRVTDSHGRYVFFPPIGSYHIETNTNQFKFPSVFLGVVKDDSDFLDLYHGETIEVKEAGVAITANIPLDPLGAELPLWKLVGRLAWRRLQHFFSVLSLLIALGFAIWVPSIITISLLGAQAVFYALFLRLAIPRKPKSWGIVYDEKTHKPLARTVARIFDKQYNKLLETQVTDKTGRYSFLVGRNQYYVSYDKDGYEKKQSETIDLQNNSEPVASVGVDADLKPDSGNDGVTVDNPVKKIS